MLLQREAFLENETLKEQCKAAVLEQEQLRRIISAQADKIKELESNQVRLVP
jgi:hypothetical protein